MNTKKRFEVKFLKNWQAFGLIVHQNGTSRIKFLGAKTAQKMIRNLAGF